MNKEITTHLALFQYCATLPLFVILELYCSLVARSTNILSKIISKFIKNKNSNIKRKITIQLLLTFLINNLILLFL